MLTKIKDDWIDLEKISWIRTFDKEDSFLNAKHPCHELNLIIDGNRVDIGFMKDKEFIEAKKTISTKLEIKL